MIGRMAIDVAVRASRRRPARFVIASIVTIPTSGTLMIGITMFVPS